MTRIVDFTVSLEMEFPDSWSDDDINFFLNESSWCASNIIPMLKDIDEKHGCLCNFCSAEVRGA